MASEDTIVKKLIINDITEEEFEAKKAAGELDPNEIYLTPDKTDDKLAGKVSIAQGKENAGKVLVVSENGEVVPGEVAPIEPQAGASMPILTHVFADHKLNDISWLNADTFSWQSGDVYVAAYEHLVKDFESSGARSGWDFGGQGQELYAEKVYPSVGDKLYRAETDFVDSGLTVASIVDNNTITDSQGNTRTRANIAAPSGIVKTDTVDGITIRYYPSKDGHKICYTIYEDEVQSLYEKTGVAWYYILDIKNKQFKLPRTKHAFTGLRDSVGGYVEAGVPNITGQFYIPATYGSATASGAFTATNGGTTGSTNTVSKAGDLTVKINANRSSSVYGNSNTVQPPATQMYLYFYVGNFEQSALEQAAGITSEQLNNKLDKSAEIYLVPTGTVSAFAGSTPPTGWLKCDGSVVSRTTYAKLFTAIGSLYGAGDGSTTFNLPNLTGRVPLGMLGSYVGQSSNGCLPNITGSLTGAKGASNPSGTGAIAVYGRSYEGTYGSGGGQYYSWDFNAARSNSMYGSGWFDGERVVPASVGMTYCIKY